MLVEEKKSEPVGFAWRSFFHGLIYPHRPAQAQNPI